MGIASSLGKPLKVDLTTRHCDRARFARICVEVNLLMPLKGTVLINGERYFVSYEGLSKICSLCGVYGHLVHTCPRGAGDRSLVVVDPKQDKEVTTKPSQAEGFVEVRRTGRRQENQTKKMVFAAGTSKDGGERKWKEVPKNQGVVITNRFGGLAEVTESPMNQETGIMEGDNKENEERNIMIMPEKKTQQFKEGNLNGIGEKGKSGSRVGGKGRRAGPLKVIQPNGPRQKPNNIFKPMKGLVYGLTKEEEGLSTNGKRLRVERESLGRPGGVFGSSRGEDRSSGSADSLNSKDIRPSPTGMGEESAMVVHVDQSGGGPELGRF